MKKLIILLLLILSAAYAKSQEKDDFSAFAKKEKIMMLKAYGKKDIPTFRKHLREYLERYNELNDKEKQNYSYYMQEEYYLLAGAYALAGDKENALDCLVKSEDDDYDELLHDHDLDALRKEPEFIKMLNTAKEKKDSGSKLVTLQKAPKYNMEEQAGLPAFTYQPADNPNLVALKKAFNLDSVAGQGNDISRIINLMEWVHYLVPHNGSKGNPPVKNAMSLISECKQNHKTLNCRGMAILLNEVYLAEGFKSRFVTCLPKDTADQDCHVINVVWSESLKKWVWMDPTFMGYVMNENGDLLSIEEVRERLISNKPLIMNPDANHNRNETQVKSEYLDYYMAKNLYKMECPVSSEYNYETSEENKKRAYIQLLPGNTKPAPAMQNNKHGVTAYTIWYTNNPKTFWAAPTHGSGTELAKSAKDYERVMKKFKTFYNQRQVDSIAYMFPVEMRAFITAKMMDNLTKKYGKIISCKYVAREEGNEDVALFKMVCDNSVHMMGISINKNNKMETFRFETSSPYIDKLLAKEL